MNDIPTFKKGDKVINQYGRILTVLFQRGVQIFVAEESLWYHPTKIWKIESKD